MLLTDQQLYQIREIVQKYHDAFIVSAIGPEAVAPAILEKLTQLGLVRPQVRSIEDAYLYGQLLATLENPKVSKMTFAEFKAYLAKNPIPLTAGEKHAVQLARLQAAQYVKGLGNRIDAQTGQLAIEADHQLRQHMETDIREATAENIAKRETVKKLKSDLGWKTRDWARDWDRIARTEKKGAMLHGQADHVRKRHGHKAMVAKRPFPTACPHCKRLYLSGDVPRIFRLRDLEANGTNHGRKVNEWLPTLGPLHPQCQCSLVRIPDGWGFDEEGDLVPGGELGHVYESQSELQLALLRENDFEKSYKLAGKVNFQGLTIAIETPVGGVRKWSTPEGEHGETVMQAAYGYIEGTGGADGEELDVYLGPWAEAPQAFIVHQQNPRTGLYDEDKVFLGFASQQAAETCYQLHYTDPESFLITTTPMEMEHFKRWIGETTVPDGVLKKTGGVRLVIPLEKAEIPPEIGGMTSRVSGRNPSPGTSANYLMGEIGTETQVPSRVLPDAAAITTPKEEMAVKRNRKAVKRDKRVYQAKFPVPVVPKLIVFPPGKVESDAQARDGAEDRKKRYLDTYYRNLGRPKNKPLTEGEEEKDEDEENQTPEVLH